MKTRPLMFVSIIVVGLLLSACTNLQKESGRKSEYNTETGRFETSDYASVGLSSGKQPGEPKPVSEKDLKKAKGQ